LKWKRKPSGNFALSNTTSALDTGEVLGSRLGRFIPGEGGYLKLTRGCVGPRAILGETKNSRPYRNSKLSETILNPIKIQREIKNE
jgi:hypothetical protein